MKYSAAPNCPETLFRILTSSTLMFRFDRALAGLHYGNSRIYGQHSSQAPCLPRRRTEPWSANDGGRREVRCRHLFQLACCIQLDSNPFTPFVGYIFAALSKLLAVTCSLPTAGEPTVFSQIDRKRFAIFCCIPSHRSRSGQYPHVYKTV